MRRLFLFWVLSACTTAPPPNASPPNGGNGGTAEPTPTRAPRSAPAASAGQAESVKPGINDSFLAEDMKVESFVDRFETESREVFILREELVKALEIPPGAAVADVGAGTGLHLDAFYEAVGPTGRIYAVDLAPKFVVHLKARAQKEGLKNVTAVQSTEKSAALPSGSVDLVWTCDTYHHFEYPTPMLASLYDAIRPGGSLIIVDFERIPGVSKEWILGHVRAGKETVIQEIVAAGFELDQEIEVDGLEENYMLRFRRP